MKTYTNIKQARSDLRKLTEMYQYINDKKEELNATLSSDSSYDKRAEAFAYRLALNEMQNRIKEIKKNIKRLDTEITEKYLQDIINKNIRK